MKEYPRSNLMILLILLAMRAVVTAADVGNAQLSNTFCPVTTDELAEPHISLNHDGRTVYFCCKKCRKEFIADPTPFLANLPPIVPVTASAGEQHQGDLEEQAASLPNQHSTAHVESTGHSHEPADAAENTITKAQRLLGKLHPLVVHFPIALILAAALAEALSLVMKNSVVYPVAGQFCIIVGAAGAAAAASLGWLAGEFASYTGPYQEVLFRHRWLGVATAVLAVTTALAGWRCRAGSPSRCRTIYRAMLALTAVAVAAAGHFGATLIYGLDYFSW